MSNTDKIFKPRRGTKSNFTNTELEGNKSNIVLDTGEVFFEVPDTGQGSGRGRIKMGDGITEYSNLPYFLPFTEDEIIVHDGTDTKSISASSSIQSSSIATNLNNAKSGNTLKTIIHNLREAIYKAACDIKYLDTGSKSYIGMIIYSTVLSTESDVITQYGGTTWIQLSGYILRGATSNVTANSNNKDSGNDSVSYTPSGSVSSSFSGTAASLSHTGGSVSATTLTTDQIPSHSHKISKILTNVEASGYGLTQSPTGFTNSVIIWNNKNKISTESTGGGKSHTHDFTQPSAHSYTPAGSVSSSFTGSSKSITTLPKYKNVYIWERTA